MINTLRIIITTFSLLLLSVSNYVVAQSETRIFFAQQGGITKLHSTRTRSKISIIPAPSGIEQGVLNIAFNTQNNNISISGGTLLFSDFNIKIGSGFSSTQFLSTQTRMDFLVPAIGSIDENFNAIFKSESINDKNNIVSIKTTATFSDCSGVLCIALSTLDLNLTQYTLTANFSENFSQWQGEIQGITANGSSLSISVAAHSEHIVPKRTANKILFRPPETHSF